MNTLISCPGLRWSECGSC